MQGFYRHAVDRLRGADALFASTCRRRRATAACRCCIYLAGLTCTEETFAIKAGAQRVAAELGLMLVAPDTSPRDTGIDGRHAATGTSATAPASTSTPPQAPWRRTTAWTATSPTNCRRWSPHTSRPTSSRCGIFGHSMGGHGALTLALRHPDRFRSVSAFAPIVAPSQVPWGQKAFAGYLGDDRARLGASTTPARW